MSEKWVVFVKFFIIVEIIKDMIMIPVCLSDLFF